MKVLFIHSDFIEWEPKKKAMPSAEKAEKKPVRVEDALVVFSAVEKQDEKNLKQVRTNVTRSVIQTAKQVGARRVVIYPFVHLSQDPAKPDSALSLLKDLESGLKSAKTKLAVKRAPFGWYKSFDIKCKGHPLAELSKEITAEGAGEKAEEVPEALKKEETLKSNWYIMEPSGRMHPIEINSGSITGYNFKGHKGLEKFAMYEMAKSRLVKEEPPHIRLMKKLELVGHEPGSDPGNMRYLPKGKMVKSLIEEWTTRNITEYGAMEVETPLMYDYEHPSLKAYLNRFPARQYTIETPNKRVFLRFSACFGQFLMAHDANISYRNLPMKMYELTRYSFRVEQRGELAGLRRLRAFTMPDCHALCSDMEQAKSEIFNRFGVAKKTMDGCGVTLKDDMEVGLRVVKDFYDKNRDFMKRFAKKVNKPILVEMWDKKFFYFVFKYEWNFVDALNKAAALTTDQIDVENGKNYGLTFTDKDNKKKNPIILHMSPSGAIERVMYALLEKAYMEQKAGKNATLPLWLSPTQVRLCPVNESLVKDCGKLAESMEKEDIRVDIDDRSESVGKKINDAEQEWIPLIIVFGEREKKSGKLAVRFRHSSEVKNMSLSQVINHVRKETDGMPRKPLPLPKLLTKRPVFVA